MTDISSLIAGGAVALVEVDPVDGAAIGDRIAAQAAASAAAGSATAAALDAVATAADRVATGQDRTATHTDKLAADADAAATAADRVQTGLDRVQTGVDVVSANGATTTTLGYLNSVSALAITIASYALAAQLAAASASAVSQASLAGVTRATMLSATIGAQFLYNARLDTDGGAWLRKVSKTSYANETLNTATRGSTALPPAFSKWVGSTDLISCFDFTNPTSPALWKSWPLTGAAISSIRALNGYVVIGTSNSGVYEFDLILDKVYWRQTGGFYVADQNVASFNRGTAVWTSLGATSSDGAIGGNSITALAMTVMPLTPLNPNRRNLPNPTIAIAHNIALQVVRSDNRVVAGASGAGAASLDFIESGNERILVAVASGHIYTFDLGCVHSSFAAAQDYTIAVTPWLAGTPATMATGGKLVAIGTTSGAAILQRDRWVRDNGMGAFITHRFNTGWVPSTAKFAFAESSADVSTIVGPTTNLAVNGDFATGDLTGWTTVAGSGANVPSVTGNVCYLPATAFTAGNFAEIGEAIPTVIGRIYRVTCDAVAGALNLRVGSSAGISDMLFVFTPAGTSRVAYFVATATTSYVDFYAGALQGGTTGVDNVKVERVIADRTSNSNSANIVGSITRAVVATGAEQAAYGGFSALNYIEVPANTALDFSTGDMFADAWINRTSSANTDQVFSYGNGSNDNTGGFGMRITSTAIEFNLSGQTGSVAVVVPTGWHHVAWAIRSGFIEIYLDGKRLVRVATAVSLTKVGATLRIGNSDNNSVSGVAGSYFTGSIALPGIAAGAPTADQIAYMYDTERAMFQPNAKCLIIGGASYTALAVGQPAYNPTQDQLAYPVSGTGVSLFEGPLIRVGFFQASTASANYVVGSGMPGFTYWNVNGAGGALGALSTASNSWGNGRLVSFTEDGTTGNHNAQSSIGAFTPVGLSSIAIPVKQGSRSWAILNFNNIAATAYVNLSTGAVGTLVGCTFVTSFQLSDGTWVFQFSFTSSALSASLRVFASTGNGVLSYAGDNGASGPAIYIGDPLLVVGNTPLTASTFQYGLTRNDNVSRVSYSDGVLVMGDAAGVNTIFPSIALREKLTAQYPTPAYDPLRAVISIQTTNATPVNMVLPIPILEGQSRMIYATVGMSQYGPTKTEKALYSIMGLATRDVGGNLAVNPASQPAAATIYETTSTNDVQMAALTTGDLGALPVLSLTGKAGTTEVWTAQIEIADNFQMAA
jgi:hypothetical protein